MLDYDRPKHNLDPCALHMLALMSVQKPGSCISASRGQCKFGHHKAARCYIDSSCDVTLCIPDSFSSHVEGARQSKRLTIYFVAWRQLSS